MKRTSQKRTGRKGVRKLKKYKKRERIYPARLLKTAKLVTTAKATHMNLPPGYHFHYLSTTQRKSAVTLAALSTVCQKLISKAWATVHLQSALKKGNVITVTHGTKSQIVAFIIFKTRGAGAKKSHYIDLVCTRRTHQGKGLGTILIRHAILLFFRTAPVASIYLKTWQENNAFYEKLGFQMVRHTPPHAKSSSLSMTKASEDDGMFYMKLVRDRARFARIAKNLNHRLLHAKHQ